MRWVKSMSRWTEPMIAAMAQLRGDATMAAMNTSCRARLILGLAMLTLAVGGCVQRTIHITSEPAGALVHLNDQEVGRTPLRVPYLFYGTYDVRLRKEGFAPLWVKQKTKTPWWEAPGPDLVAELIPNNKVEQNWHYRLKAADFVAEDALIERAASLRGSIASQDEASGESD
jgi:hypothetical protein